MTARGFRWAAALVATTLLAACDNPVGNGHEGRDAIGARIYAWQDGQVGVLLTEHTQGTWTSGIELVAGTSLAVAVRFIDPQGQEFILGETGDYTLRWTFNPATVVRYDGQGEFGRLVPLATGTAQADVRVWHGSHSDWTPPTRFPIVVVAP
jgi:hypothetical protein